jgi:glycosyltransferase involved in cell wall biosynthesis
MNVEIIVVDDASTDGTVKMAKSLGCRVICHETTRGQVAGKNTGLKAVRGEYVLFHDHDDVMNDNALSILYQELYGDENILLVMARAQDFFSPELSEGEKRQIKIRTEAYYGLFTGTALMRRKLFDITGFFDVKLTAGEIINFMIKIDQLKLPYKKIDIVASNRRIHAANFGRTNALKEKKDYSAILRAKLRDTL